MIDTIEISTLAIKSIWQNKVRSALTMLGIIIGVAAVILLVSVGQGLQNYISGAFEDLGSNLVLVIPGTVQFGQGPPNFSGSRFTLKHLEDLNKLGSPVGSAAGSIEIPAVIRYKGNSKTSTVAGISSEYSTIRNLEVSEGELISEDDIDRSRRVVVLGQGIEEELFGQSQAIGKNIDIGGTQYEVIGILNKIGTQSIGFDVNNFVAIPVTSAQKLFNNDSIQAITVQAESQETIPDVIDEVEDYFLAQMNEDDFSVVDQSSLLETITQILGVLTAALGGIAAISLVVGGVGIMNIMLVSVTERTREIGLRKAIGARRSNILSQFLIESVTLSVVGGGIGILIGWGGSLIINQFFPASVTLWSVLLAFGVSAAVGILFGVAPAIRASKLDPIEALRYE